MARYIDADKIEEQFNRMRQNARRADGESDVFSDGMFGAVCACITVLHDQPTDDVAPVVRCKDCRHSYDAVGGRCCNYGVCVDCTVEDDFYCADGKRKDDDLK